MNSVRESREYLHDLNELFEMPSIVVPGERQQQLLFGMTLQIAQLWMVGTYSGFTGVRF